MILTNALNIFCNGKKDPDMFVNSVHVWPLSFTSYTVKFEWSPAKQDNICLDGMGWGDSIGFIHSENINWAYYDDGNYHELTSAEIIHATSDDGTPCEKYCYEMAFNLKGSTLDRFEELTFKTGPYYQPTGTLKVTITGYSSDNTVVLASKTVNMNVNTTYHIHAGEFDT